MQNEIILVLTLIPLLLLLLLLRNSEMVQSQLLTYNQRDQIVSV